MKTLPASVSTVILVLALSFLASPPTLAAPPTDIVIDGDMSDWTGVPSYFDDAGDNTKPGTDILEFRVTHDETSFYYYSRHAGPIVSEDAGTGGQGRYYYLLFIDLDNNPATGFNPDTIDPDCYSPAMVGCDLEFEFERDWNNQQAQYIVQHFYGYGGPGTLLQNQLDLKPGGFLRFGPADYDNKAQFKFLGENIPADMVFTNDITKLGYTPGMDVFMRQAFSGDMTESEICVDFRAALVDATGTPNLAIGKTISLALACESSPWADCGDGMAAVQNYVLEGPVTATPSETLAPTETPTPSATETETETSTPSPSDSPTDSPTPTLTPIPGDMDASGVVDGYDLFLFSRDWDHPADQADPRGNLEEDDFLNGKDLLRLIHILQ
jgi:hypothetical protein